MTTASIANLFSVQGRIALVTGGSSGLGFMIAQGLVSNGCKVYITALETDDIDGSVAQLNALCVASGGQASGFTSDISSKEGIGLLAQFISEREEYLDILISNAGIRRDPPITVHVPTASLNELQASLWSSKHSDWDATFRVNCTAHYFLSVALLKLLVQAAHRRLPDGRPGSETGRGIIVITSSCASLHNSSNIDLSSYATSKAGLDHLVALLATKFAPWYVRVNSINPGFVPSKMNPVEEGSNQFASLFEKMPAKRIGKMEDVAGTVLWLCSQAGSYVDGRCICVDGGRVLLANGQ